MLGGMIQKYGVKELIHVIEVSVRNRSSTPTETPMAAAIKHDSTNKPNASSSSLAGTIASS